MSITDGKRRIATESDCRMRWAGAPDNRRFRCYMCGHKFAVGDGYRWQYSNNQKFKSEEGQSGMINLLTCDTCDGPDLLDRWQSKHEAFYGVEFWALR